MDSKRILNFKWYENEKALFSSPWSISPDGANSAKSERDWSTMQHTAPELPEWGVMAALRVQAGYKCPNSILMLPPLGQPSICLPSLTCKDYFLYTLTYKRLKSTSLLYCKANFSKICSLSSVQKYLYSEQLSSIISKKKQKQNIASSYKA